MGEARAGFTSEAVEVVTASPTKPYGFTHEAARLHPRSHISDFQITAITDLGGRQWASDPTMNAARAISTRRQRQPYCR